MSRVVGRFESEMTLGYAAVLQLALHLLDCVEALPEPQRAVLEAVLGKTEDHAPDPFRVGLAVLGLAEEAADAHDTEVERRVGSHRRPAPTCRCQGDGEHDGCGDATRLLE
jgi:hypothetical protein